MKKTFVIAVISGLMLFAACENKTSKTLGKEEKKTKLAATSHTFENVNQQTADMMKSLFGHYVHLKNALVNADAKEAKAGANAMLDVITGFDSSALPPEQYTVYNSHITAVREDITHIAGSDDLEHQREHLVTLSDHMYKLVKAFGAGKEVYYSYCPMANDDKGAYWLSESEKIRNPYFGDKMMSCGENKEMIKP